MSKLNLDEELQSDLSIWKTAKEADLATAQRERDERQDAYSSALVKLGKTLRRTEDLERELAEAQAEMSRANREREAENLRAFRLEARLFDIEAENSRLRAALGHNEDVAACAEFHELRQAS